LERRKRNVVQVAAEVAKEDPDRAAGIIQGAEIALPSLGSFIQSEALLYERRVETALLSLGYVSTGSNGVDYGYDFELFRPAKPETKVYVEVKYRRSARLDTSTVRDLIGRSVFLRAPFLIVTNADLTASSAAFAAEDGREFPVRVVRWHGESDNRALGEAVVELFGPLG
jgi:S1-C subfamily serine protease